MIKIGLTGSIGMGKSTTAKMFADEGVPVWDADAAVGRLYSKGGLGVDAVSHIAPDAIDENGVNRSTLKALIMRDKTFLTKLEAVVHPLVVQDRLAFFETHHQADIVVLDIPLLFENGTQNDLDMVVVVSTSTEEQRRRVMERETMDAATFDLILSKQIPDAEKRKKADFVIETTTIDSAREQVQNILADIRGQIDA